MSDFFSFICSSILAAVCSAESWRSVLKMLNSLSSWPKAAPVSALAASSMESTEPWPSPTIMVCRMLSSRLRSAVKSWRMSTDPPLKRMMEIRSAVVICVRTKVSAAASARS